MRAVYPYSHAREYWMKQGTEKSGLLNEWGHSSRRGVRGPERNDGRIERFRGLRPTRAPRLGVGRPRRLSAAASAGVHLPHRATTHSTQRALGHVSQHGCRWQERTGWDNADGAAHLEASSIQTPRLTSGVQTVRRKATPRVVMRWWLDGTPNC